MQAQYSSKPRELAAAEPTQAACYYIVDIGQHEVTDRQTGKTSLKPQLMIGFELETKRSDGLPFILSKTFTNSLHKKSNLRAFLESWEGRKFSEGEVANGWDMDQYLNRNAIITPIHNEGYANIGGISKIRAKDVPFAPSLKNLPKWVHDKIAKAKVAPEGYVAPTEQNDMPF